MAIVIALLFFLYGLVLTSFTIVPILIMFRVGFPVTKRCDEKRMLKRGGAKTIRRRYTRTILILSSAFILSTILMQFIFNPYTLAFGLGAVWAILSAVGKTGMELNNLTDYRETNTRYFTNEGLAAFQRLIAQAITHPAQNVVHNNSKGVL